MLLLANKKAYTYTKTVEISTRTKAFADLLRITLCNQRIKARRYVMYILTKIHTKLTVTKNTNMN